MLTDLYVESVEYFVPNALMEANVETIWLDVEDHDFSMRVAAKKRGTGI